MKKNFWSGTSTHPFSKPLQPAQPPGLRNNNDNWPRAEKIIYYLLFYSPEKKTQEPCAAANIRVLFRGRSGLHPAGGHPPHERIAWGSGGGRPPSPLSPLQATALQPPASAGSASSSSTSAVATAPISSRLDPRPRSRAVCCAARRGFWGEQWVKCKLFC